MGAPLKVLCLAPYPVEGASARLRVLQFLPYLREHGVEVTYRPFMDSEFFRGFYRPGRTLGKAAYLAGAGVRRLGDVGRAAGHDVVLVHREAALFGPPVIEALIARAVRTPMVFDFDDAIHVPYVSPTFGRAASLVKYPQKTPQIVRMSRAVIAGNRNLESYARGLNPSVTRIPTVVDTEIVRPRAGGEARGPVVLGWMGTHSTYPYLESLFPVIREVARRHPIRVRVVGTGREVSIPGVEVESLPWTLETELRDLQSFDVGLYPIVEDRWSLGKSGYKAVQYMAVGIPAVCSPVGATCDVVRDGMDGFLPTTEEEWVERLCSLIEDPALRRRMGETGRARVEEGYSVAGQAPRLRAVLEEAAG